jgi:hypothetical protein
MRAIMMQVLKDIRLLSKSKIIGYNLFLIVETNRQWKKEISKSHLTTFKR